MFVPASVTGPKVTHAALIDVPRNSGSYQHRAAVGTLVKSASSRAHLPPES
jgi:hypothetical protein